MEEESRFCVDGGLVCGLCAVVWVSAFEGDGDGEGGEDGSVQCGWVVALGEWRDRRGGRM